jgi:phosphotransferase system enzyme I (PtsI)
MAGDPEFTQLLLAMGLRSLSMHPSQIAAIKQRVLRTDTRRWAAHLARVLAADDPERECKAVALAMSPLRSEEAIVAP